MYFDSSDLQQFTPEYVQYLSPERRAVLVEQLRKDLIEAQDRLNQNSTNSSRPSSSQFPWDRSLNSDDEELEQKEDNPKDPEPLKDDGKREDKPDPKAGNNDKPKPPKTQS